ncbi:MAG TPA: tetratricopeptide repeat protein [Blastocatellia bacterium]|nr:tetratricopeptide repeat protein [Blastocatellia bacterium]
MAERTETKQSENKTLVALDTGIGDMPFGRAEYLTEEEAARKREALEYFKQAYEAQMRGELDEAADLYRESIAVYPTAEAHTFLGWTYSFMGLTDEAIEECHRAIEVDPDFGNPYNDIGAYLIEKGDLYGAINWLKRAMDAPRYECYFYPHFNLGRIYEAQGRLFDALREYKAAIDLNPNYALAIKAFRRLQAKLN